MSYDHTISIHPLTTTLPVISNHHRGIRGTTADMCTAPSSVFNAHESKSGETENQAGLPHPRRLYCRRRGDRVHLNTQSTAHPFSTPFQSTLSLHLHSLLHPFHSRNPYLRSFPLPLLPPGEGDHEAHSNPHTSTHLPLRPLPPFPFPSHSYNITIGEGDHEAQGAFSSHVQS